DLDGYTRQPGNASDMFGVVATGVERAIHVYHVEPAGPLSLKPFGLRQRIVGIDGFQRPFPLEEAHDLAAFDIDRGLNLHGLYEEFSYCRQLRLAARNGLRSPLVEDRAAADTNP